MATNDDTKEQDVSNPSMEHPETATRLGDLGEEKTQEERTVSNVFHLAAAMADKKNASFLLSKEDAQKALAAEGLVFQHTLDAVFALAAGDRSTADLMHSPEKMDETREILRQLYMANAFPSMEHPETATRLVDLEKEKAPARDEDITAEQEEALAVLKQHASRVIDDPNWQFSISEEAAEKDKVLAALRDMYLEDEKIRAAHINSGMEQDPARTVPASGEKQEVKIIGDVPQSDVERHKAKYGNSLISVRAIDPNDVHQNIQVRGFFQQGLDAVFSKQLGKTVEMVPDERLIALYHKNVSGMCELPVDPDHFNVRVVGHALTKEQEAVLLNKWHYSQAQIDAFHTGLKRIRQEGNEGALNLFQPLPVDFAVSHGFDSTEKLTIYAISFKVLPRCSIYVQAECVERAAEMLARAALAENLALCKRAREARFAWFTPQGYGPRMALYLCLDPFPGASDEQEEEDGVVQELAAEFKELGLL